MLDSSQQQALVTRLNRIEGQIRGIRRMVQEPSRCIEILQQLAAAEAAMNRVSAAILTFHVRKCVPDGAARGDEERSRQLGELVDIFDRSLRPGPRRDAFARLERSVARFEPVSRLGVCVMTARRMAVVLIGVLALSAVTAAQDRGKTKAQGKVVDEAGAPLGDVIVAAVMNGMDKPFQQTKTNNKGEWKVENLAAGKWKFYFGGKQGLEEKSVDAEVGASGTVNVPDVKLGKAGRPRRRHQRGIQKSSELLKAGKARGSAEDLRGHPGEVSAGPGAVPRPGLRRGRADLRRREQRRRSRRAAEEGDGSGSRNTDLQSSTARC